MLLIENDDDSINNAIDGKYIGKLMTGATTKTVANIDT